MDIYKRATFIVCPKILHDSIKGQVPVEMEHEARIWEPSPVYELLMRRTSPLNKHVSFKVPKVYLLRT